jgi:NADP-dependent 3-hydroxy acid dehydrogenase YdfG
MEKEKLRQFAIAEFLKEAPQEIAMDEEKSRNFIAQNINEPLLDKLLDEFCEKNPEEFAVLNPFSLSDEENIKRVIPDGIIERLKYEQVVNNAGLAYQTDKMAEYIALIDAAVKDRH